MGTNHTITSQPLPQREAWGLLGGTFNPPHWGHIQIAQAALLQAKLHRVLWVPAYRPLHRRRESVLAFDHRLAMVQVAIAPYPNFHVSHIERTLPATSFAIDTLTQLQEQHPNVDWTWILGLDTFSSLPRWYQGDRLIPQCTWLIAPRPAVSGLPTASSTAGAVMAPILRSIQVQAAHWQAQGIKLDWRLLDMHPIPIASSNIRQRVRDRQPIDSLVPAAVKAYIQQHKLYLTTGSPSNE